MPLRHFFSRAADLPARARSVSTSQMCQATSQMCQNTESPSPSMRSGLLQSPGQGASHLEQFILHYYYHFSCCIMTCSCYKQKPNQVLSLSEINLDLSGDIKGTFWGQNNIYNKKQPKPSTVKLWTKSIYNFLSCRQKSNYYFTKCYNMFRKNEKLRHLWKMNLKFN